VFGERNYSDLKAIMGTIGSTPILYISFDLETLGGDPAKLPIINAGFVAYHENRTKVSEFSVNMKPGEPDQKTIEWFLSTPENKAA
jgi:hypothetical protein